jgi:hypothetical protein
MCRDSTCHASCQLPRHEAKQFSRELLLDHLALADSSARAPSLPINDSADDDDDDDDSRANRDGSMEGTRCVVENLLAILFEESVRRQNSYAKRLAFRGRASRLGSEVAIGCGRRCVLVDDSRRQCSILDLVVAQSKRPAAVRQPNMRSHPPHYHVNWATGKEPEAVPQKAYPIKPSFRGTEVPCCRYPLI